MSKLIVSANSKHHLISLLKKDIEGVIISIMDLAVNDNFYMTIDEISTLDFRGKEVFVSLNKLMHNSDLTILRETLKKLKDMNIKILFYDMAVYNIAKDYGMVDKLVIYQDHLNASSLSNKFYAGLGINTSYITQDITLSELLEIKNDNNMQIMFTIYGYSPIFYSRRYLINSYLKYINEENNGEKYTIISDTGHEYPISEEVSGTTIYTEKPINLINYYNELKEIDYLVMKANRIDDDLFNQMIDKYLCHEEVQDEYLGFFKTKTIYKVK